ncbi:hypothetical protein AJ87_21080 [Rhizobium yanglingense]|nr:hypothetical protein AJ87_21080 [Rhizobium yanglingense]
MIISIDALFEIKVVLETNSNIAPLPNGQRNETQFVTTDCECTPDRFCRSQLLERIKDKRFCWRAPRNPEAKLYERRAIDKAFGNHLSHEREMSQLKDLKPGLMPKDRICFAIGRRYVAGAR